MQEEFHGISEPRQYKLLYGWGAINANVWIPSMSELFGYDPNNYYEPSGTYASAMQGLNFSNSALIDQKGGSQWALIFPHNASGGGEKLWAACNQQQTWLRSVRMDNATNAWRTTNATTFNTSPATASRAVHSG